MISPRPFRTARAVVGRVGGNHRRSGAKGVDMHDIMKLALILACLATSALTQPLQRLLGEDALHPWAAIGRLNVQGAGFCTATLIAPDLVLTAAHCVFHPVSGRPVSPDRIHFLAGWRKGDYIAHGRARAVAIPEHYTYSPRPTDETIATDLALIALTEPLDIAPSQPIATGPETPPGTAVSVISYGKGRAEVPSLQERCTALFHVSAILKVTCHANPGTSGAPVLLTGAQGPRVTAVISAITQGLPGAQAAPLQPHLNALIQDLAR